MNLKYRFAFLFTFFVFIILLVSFTSVYYLCDNFRRDDFSGRLSKDAKSAYEHWSATQSNNGNTDKTGNVIPVGASEYNKKIVLYDSSFKKIYTTPEVSNFSIEPKLFAKAKKKGKATFKDGSNHGIVVYIREPTRQIFVAVSAYDRDGIGKIDNLRNILIITLAGGLLLSGLFAFMFVKQVMQPLNELNEQVQGITENNLDARLKVPAKDGELKRIALSFNSMLNRLQRSFDMQKNFVQHASHELRTPLANMLSQTEAALNKDLPKQELEKVLRSLRDDQVGLTELINSLLLLSQYESLSVSNNLVPVRIDEVLYETIESIKERYPRASINLDFVTVPENSNDLTIKGNETLIRTAIQNLVKNAYVYSEDDKVSISIDVDEKWVEIIFENKGLQINDDEKENLFVPFYRGENSANVKGTGMGLSLVERIVKLHNGTISYNAIEESVNRFTLRIHK